MVFLVLSICHLAKKLESDRERHNFLCKPKMYIFALKSPCGKTCGNCEKPLIFIRILPVFHTGFGLYIPVNNCSFAAHNRNYVPVLYSTFLEKMPRKSSVFRQCNPFLPCPTYPSGQSFVKTDQIPQIVPSKQKRRCLLQDSAFMGF